MLPMKTAPQSPYEAAAKMDTDKELTHRAAQYLRSCSEVCRARGRAEPARLSASQLLFIVPPAAAEPRRIVSFQTSAAPSQEVLSNCEEKRCWWGKALGVLRMRATEGSAPAGTEQPLSLPQLPANKVQVQGASLKIKQATSNVQKTG